MSDQSGQPQRRRLFARTRSRIEEFEKSNDDVRGIVEHFKTHRNAYLASAGCLALGFVAGKHRQRPIMVDVKTVINNAEAPVVETIADELQDKWNILGLSTDQLKLLLTDPTEHLHFATLDGNICVQHVNP